MAKPVAIGLGSNLGDRLAHLQGAVSGLQPWVTLRRGSAVYESAPMYVEDQPPFLNACCVGETELTARSLLEALQKLERQAGRSSGGRRFGPRQLDLDILLFGEQVIEEADLLVPHPRMAERAFVLRPLAEVAGDWLHPLTGRTVRDMAGDLAGDDLRLYAPSSTLMEVQP